VAKKRIYAGAAVGCLAVMLGTHLLSLKLEKGQLEREKATGKQIAAIVKEKQEIQKRSKTATDRVSRAKGELKKPAGLSRGSRSCLQALNAVNDVLHEMSEDILVEYVWVRPVSKAGAATSVIKITLRGDSIRDNLFVHRNLYKPLLNAKRNVGGKSLPQFSKVDLTRNQNKVNPETGDSEGSEFIFDCEFKPAD